MYNQPTKYHGPVALPPGYNQHGAPLPVHDTPEVAAEKAKHFALVARSMLHHQHHSHGFYDREDDGEYHAEDDDGVLSYHGNYDHTPGMYRGKRSAELGFEDGGFGGVNHFQQ